MIMESFKERLATTAVIYFLFLQLAIRFGIFGPTILDLKYHLGVTQSQMSIVFSVMSVGVCVGAISSGFLFKWVPKQIALASLLVILGITVSFVTRIHSYIIFSVIQFVIGVTSGAAINACEAWILEIWGEKCPPYMQALQFFRGLGYILGPIIVEPFLSPELDEDDDTTTIGTHLTTLDSNVTNSTKEKEEIVSNIYIPYMMNGLMIILGSIMILFQYLYTVRRQRQKNMMTASSEDQIMSSYERRMSRVSQLNIDIKEAKPLQPKLFTYSIIMLCSVFYLFFFEEVVVTYLASFSANIELHLSKSRGAFLTSIFNLSNVIGKAISIVLAIKLSHFTMLYMNLFVIVVSLCLLMVWANSSIVMLWVGFCLLGVGLSSIIASLYSLMESVIAMDPMVCGILNMSGTLGSVFVPLAIANYIESYPLSLIVASLFCAVSCLLLMVTIHLLISYRNKRDERKELLARDNPVIKF